MKIVVGAVFAAASLWASAASAVTFTTSGVDVTDSSFSTTVSYASNGLNNNIVIGSPLTISNFIVATITGISNSDTTGTVSAVFNFSDPSAVNSTDSGTITGTFSSSNLKGISIIWSDPISVLFADGTQLQIDLGNGQSSCTGNCAVGDHFDISGTFTLLNGPIVTPLPGALPLFATGLAGLGLIGWRRKRAR